VFKPSLILALSPSLLCALFAPSDADAACSTSTTLLAYGDFWVERDSSGQCLIKAQQYPCAASGGFRIPAAPVTIATVTPGNTSKNCEDLAGYDAAIATMLGKYAPTAGNYECDSTFVDNDQDGFGVCIDDNDNDPRVRTNDKFSETLCDGVDNDNDGVVDEGFTACEKDHKRISQANLLQGDAGGRVTLIEGALLRTETDITIQGPYGPLSFTRTYNSRRETDDAALGKGWTHSFSVYLKQMPSGDDRWQVLTPWGENQYFRCTTYGTDMSCAVDDHRISGNLRRVSSQFQWYPGDGTVWTFDDTVKGGRRAFLEHKDSAGFRLAYATTDANGRFTKVESANSSIYLYFSYGTHGLDLIRVNATSGNKPLDYNVIAGPLLDKVEFADPAVNTFSGVTYVTYNYAASTNNITSVVSKLNSTTAVTMAEFTFDGSDRVLTLKDANKDLTVSYPSATTTNVTYNVNTSGNPTTTFTHNGLWVTSRNAVDRMGGMAAANQTYDAHGRVTCFEADDSRMSKLIFSDSTSPIRIDVYGKSGTCSSGGTVDHKSWMGYDYNTNSQSLRPAWVRRTSVYSGAADCSGVSLPANCYENKFSYVSSTDDRLQTLTTTGYTWNQVTDSSATQRSVKQRTYYFGLDTGVCTSGDSYTGLPCRVERQDNAGSAFTRSDTTYNPSGSTAGLVKTTKIYDGSSDASPQTTTYASYNLFGSPGTVTTPAGYTVSYTYNGFNAVTQVTETNALLDDTTPTPGYLSPTTSYSYNGLRRIDTVTLPKGNKRVMKYFTGAGEYGRTKASATADASGNLLEIMRFDYNKFGSQTESKILDSISGTTPCADESCTTYEVRRQSSYNALRQVVSTYLHATDTADPADASTTNTYTNGQLTSASSFLGVTSGVTYDDQGRVATRTGDQGGLGATTTYAYDSAGRVLTTTGPSGLVTRTERDDFGQLVLERSTSGGDIRFEYDASGFVTKRRRSSYNSSSNAESTCYTRDWLSRQLTLDYNCDGTDWTFQYDGDSIPGSACRANTVQAGRLSTISSSAFKRVYCYHPNGRQYSTFQLNDNFWSNSGAKGSTTIFDLNGNLTKEYYFDRPDGHTYAREVEFVYDGTLKDRVSYVRHRLTSAGSWTLLTSDSTLPTYFAMGGFKTIRYANSVDETNTRDKAYRLTRRRSENGATKYTDINLTYDVGGRITTYDDSAGYRHLKYFTKYDPLSRLRCVSRSAISSCSGVEPWEDQFLESFDYDLAGNRVNRRYGAYDSADDDAYTFVNEFGVGPTNIIDKVTSGGVDHDMSNDPKGNITEVNQPNKIGYAWNPDSQLSTTNDTFLGSTTHNYTAMGDRYSKEAICNSQMTFFHYAGGSSGQLKLLNLWNSCSNEYPRTLRSYVYLEGRPISVLHSTVASSGNDTQTEVASYWVHTDQAGTPVLVTNNVRTELWRWENDPFGRSDAIEYTVFNQDVNPDDTSGNPYKTCCCTGCGAGCGQCTTGCSAGQCTGGASQAQVWTKTYTPGSANNVRLHFSSFNVKPGTTTRTGKDYLQYVASDGTTVLANLTGNLGDFWGPWSGGASVKLNFITDNVADGTSGWVVDKLEYTTTANGRYVMHLRGASSIADDDAKARFEENIAHRREDGRSLTANGSLFDGSRVYSPSRNPDGNRCLESRVRDLDHQAPGDDEECVSGGVLPNRPSEAPVPVDVVVPPNYYVLCDEGMTSSCGEDVVPATGFVLSLCNSPVPELRAAGFELARQVCAPNYNRILQASADSRWVDPQITAFCPSPTDPGSIVCVTCCRGLAVCNYSGPARPGAPKMMMCINNN
jgi:YD repeat-containing protein